MSLELKIPVNIQAPYFIEGELSNHTEELWLVFHGYGQLAKYFIRHFEPLVNGTTTVIALQGLSKYYIDNKHDRVGASWMTKDDRETDIKNQQNYIDIVLRDVLSKTGNKNIRINLLGFSQGTATVTRWAAYSKLKFNTLVLWAGTVAFELTPSDFKYLDREASNVISVMGNMDQYYSNESWQAELVRLKEIFGQVKAVGFEGKHEMNKETLLKLNQR